MARFIIDQLENFKIVPELFRNQGLDILDDSLFRLSKSDAPVDEDTALIRHSIIARANTGDSGNRDASLPQEWMLNKISLHITDAGNHRQHLINGIVPHIVAGCMGASPLCHNFQLNASLVAAIDLHIGRLANHNKIRFDSFPFNKRLTSNAVTPFLDVAQVIDRVPIQQP